MSLKQALQAFVDHRRVVLERRSKFRLEKIAARLEVLEGYLAVFLNLDKVIKIIRTEDEPKPKLMKAFGLNDNQAEAILNMRLRALRKLEEMEIRGEHAALTKEQKELAKLLGSDKLKSERLIEEVKAIDAKFGGKTKLGKRRTEIAGARDVRKLVGAGRGSGGTGQRGGERTHHHRLFAESCGCARSKGHQEQSDDDQIPRRRQAPFLDSRPDHRPADDAGHRRPLLHAGLQQAAGRARQWRSDPQLHRSAARSRYRRDVRACAGPQAAAGRQLRPWLHHQRRRRHRHDPGRQAGDERQAGRGGGGGARRWKAIMVAAVGDNRKLLIFPLSEVPEMARGQGVYLQKYKDGGLTDATSFTWKEGLKDENGRLFAPSDLKEWRGERAQAGRIVPNGWARRASSRDLEVRESG